MEHDHARLDVNVKAGIDRPPDLDVRTVTLARFRRGEGCCEADVVRECTAFYDHKTGELLGVYDPWLETRGWDRREA